MSKKKVTLINVFAAVIAFGVQMLISLWVSPYVVGKLGEEAYGFINLANNFVLYASLVSIAFNSMACRFISVEYNCGRENEAKSFFSTVFIVNCILYSIVFIVSIIIIYKLEYIINISFELVTQVKITFLLSFVNMGITLIGTVYTAATFTTNQMHLSSIVQIVSNVIKSGIVLSLFFFLPPKIYYLSIAALLAGIVVLGGNIIFTRRLLKGFSVDFRLFSFEKVKILIKSGIWILISNVSNMLLNGLDLLISNLFISSVIMGRLSIAKQIPFAFNNALGVFSNIFSSALTKTFASEGKVSLQNEAKEQMRLLAFFFTVPYAGVIVFGKDFLVLWLKKAEYSNYQLKEIYILMILVLLDIIVSTYMYSIHSVFIALDKVRIYSIILLSASVISIGTTLFLLKNTGLGVYAIAGVSTVVLGFTHGIIVPGCAGKLLNQPIATFWKTELKSWFSLGVISCLFTIIRFVLHSEGWISFFINVMISAALGYGVSALLILNKNERLKLFKLVESKLKRKL